MRYGPIVAKRYKKQYCKYNKWETYQWWTIQPEQIHTILLELKSKEAILALVGDSWTRRLPRRTGIKK